MDPIALPSIEFGTLLYAASVAYGRYGTLPGAVMAAAFVIHADRFWHYKDSIFPWTVRDMWVVLIACLAFMGGEFILQGAALGLLMIWAYREKEKDHGKQFGWLNVWIDPPMLLASSWIAYQAHARNDFFLFPFMSAAIYHASEIIQAGLGGRVA